MTCSTKSPIGAIKKSEFTKKLFFLSFLKLTLITLDFCCVYAFVLRRKLFFKPVRYSFEIPNQRFWAENCVPFPRRGKKYSMLMLIFFCFKLT